MSVLFHLAVQQDWERASSARAYTTASLREDGFTHCVTATQHARVANDLYTGRTDLVLLLGPRFKDRRDFDHVLPYLDGAARAWLGAALEQVHPGHAWRDRL